MFDKREQKDKQHFDGITEQYVNKDQIAYNRFLRKLRLDSTLANVPRPLGRILELGCAAGYTAEYLRGWYSDYMGVDYSERLIAYARQAHRYPNVRFACHNIKDFDVQGRFDVILMMGVLHHVSGVHLILNQIKKWLKQDGIVVVNEPQRGNPIIGLCRNIRKRIDKTYSQDQIAFTEDELRTIFVASGYLVKAYPQGYLSSPLAETSLFPNWIGYPLAMIFQLMDPVLERCLASTPWRRWAWNIVVEARSASESSGHINADTT